MPVRHYLERWQQAGHLPPQSQVLLMGLCGSLAPQHSVGDVVLYERCVDLLSWEEGRRSPQPPLKRGACSVDPELTAKLYRQLQDKVTLGVGLTSDRAIDSAEEKRNLGQQFGADVVDMEGFPVLEVLGEAEMAVAMLRVVSDDCHGDIPDLTGAFNADGSLQSVALAVGLMRQPLAGMRLIRGAMQGLRKLQTITALLLTQINTSS
jgi:nucleoside phosphorylase